MNKQKKDWKYLCKPRNKTGFESNFVLKWSNVMHLHSTFRDSSAVEQVAVNDKVLGSNPSRGAR